MIVIYLRKKENQTKISHCLVESLSIGGYRVRSVTNSNNFTTIYDSAIDSLPRMTLGRVLIYATSRESAEKLVSDYLARQLAYARKVYSESEKKMKLSSFLIDKLS